MLTSWTSWPLARRACGQPASAEDCDVAALRYDVRCDRNLLRAFAAQADTVQADQDPKLAAAVEALAALSAQAEHSLTQGTAGGILLQDHYLVEKMAQFNRERVPERVVHAKGAGAFGEFIVTDDVSAYTKADFLQPGKKTEMLARFSSVATEQG